MLEQEPVIEQTEAEFQPFRLPPFGHQREELNNAFIFNRFMPWEMGCVDGETEYLTPTGWKPIRAYTGGKVAQWHPETRQIEFVVPLEYIKKPCNEMIHIKNARGVDQMLSFEHRVPFLQKRTNKLQVVEARDLLNLPKDNSTSRRLPGTFFAPSGKGLSLTEDQLRVQVAAMADGSLVNTKRRDGYCVMNLKRPLKVARMKALLETAKIFYRERKRDDGYTTYVFHTPWHTKTFGPEFWEATKEQLAVIADEAGYWDGTLREKSTSFYSTVKESADFMQYAMASTGHYANLLVDDRPDRPTCWMVHRRLTRGEVLHVRGDNISIVKPADGFKYCFSVPSSFLLLRRNGKIFPTGNSGKSKLCIDTASILWRQQRINCVVVIAPNGVHRNWHSDELPKHLPHDVQPHTHSVCYQTDKVSTKYHQKELNRLFDLKGRSGYPGLSWLSISYDGVATAKGFEFVWKLMDCKYTLLIVDESHYVKTPKAEITRKLRNLTRIATYRRVMTGTPTDGNPFDLYSQIAICSPKFWTKRGIYTFTEFKNRYGIWRRELQPRFRHLGPPRNKKEERERTYPVLVRYQRIDELRDLIGQLGTRITKGILNLPEKLYTKRYVPMTREQRAAYKQMKEKAFTIIRGETCTTQVALATLMKLHQITSGFIKMDNGEIQTFPGKNPRIEAVRDIVETAQGKVIVWATFTHNIDQLMDALQEHNPLRYDGSVSQEDKFIAKRRFQEDNDHKVIIINPLAGAEGLTLIQAKTSIYYSNNFRLIKRQQSEDRNHRIGQKNEVLYIDLIAEDSIDQKIVQALRNKFDIASQLTGDELKTWI